MSTKKKQYSAQLKAKVALEAVRAEKSISELASQYEIQPTVINKGKKKLLEEANRIFAEENQVKKEKIDSKAHIDELYRQIGQLKVEQDFLASRSERLGLPTAKPW